MNKAFVFDLDDTLVKTTARVKVVNTQTGEEVVSLTPAQFNKWSLTERERFDFSDFRSPKFIKDGQPTFLIHLAKEVYDEGHNVYILTARSDNVADAIAGFLERFGILAKTIHCVGSDDGVVDISKEKSKILMAIIDKYDRCYYYDDHCKNVEDAPDSHKIRKYLINAS